MKVHVELGEEAYVVKDKLFRYRIVYPIKNKDGSMNWFNFFTGGSWGNIFVVMFVVALMVFLVFQYNKDISQAVDCCNNACQNLVKGMNLNVNPEPFKTVNYSELLKDLEFG